MTSRTKRTWTCPQCHRLLAIVRPEMIILRRLTFTNAAVGHERTGDTVRIRCECGATVTIHWSRVQP